MQFLYPKFLWALFALIFPVIIHFFNFRRYKTVYFSHVNFLQKVTNETKSRSNLKHLVILIVRIVAVCAMVIAFARPYIPINGQIKSGINNSINIYVDNSFSMEAEGKYGVLLESAKMKAIEIAESFTQNTMFRLITNDFNIKHNNLLNKEQFIDEVSKIKVNNSTRTLNEVILRKNALSDINDSLSINYFFIISDLQKNSIDLKNLLPHKNDFFYIINYATINTNNLSIDSVWPTNPGTYYNKIEELNVKISNYSNSSYTDIPITLYINDTVKSVTNFNIGANQTTQIQMSYLQNNYGFNNCRIEISDYPITFDNTVYFNYEINKQVSVLYISNNINKNFFSSILQNDSNFVFNSSPINQIQFDKLSMYQYIIIDYTDQLSTGLINAMNGFVKNGGNIFIALSPTVNINSYNTLLNKIGAPVINELIEQTGVTTNLQNNHNLFKGVFKDQDFKQAKLPSYNQYFGVNIPQNSNTISLLETEAGTPFLTITKYNNGLLTLLLTPLNNQSTNLYEHPLWVPIVYNSVLQSGQVTTLYYTIKPGAVAIIKTPENGPAQIALNFNNDNNLLLPASINVDGITKIYPETELLKAGVYKVLYNNKLISYLSYNYNRLESDITYYDAKILANSLIDAGAKNAKTINSDNVSIGNIIIKNQNGNDVTFWFLLLIILMLLIEMFLLRKNK